MSRLSFVDEGYINNAFEFYNMLRKGGDFCDVTLIVGERQVKAHRCILASASAYIYEMFLSAEKEDSARPAFIKLPSNVTYQGFSHLVDYAYTSKLEVDDDAVKDVYQCAVEMRMMRPAQACISYLINTLTPANCLGLRLFAHANPRMTSLADEYISSNVVEVMSESKELSKLPLVPVNLYTNEIPLCNSSDKELALCQLVLNWLQKEMDELNVDSQVIMDCTWLVFLTEDNKLRELERKDVEKPEQLTMLARSKKERQAGSGHMKRSPSWHTFSPNSRDQLGSTSSEWKLICSQLMTEKSLLCVATLDGLLMRISINMSTVICNNVATGNGDCLDTSVLSLQPLALLTSPRCSMGSASVNGCVMVLGGYNRTECLSSVECYNPAKNTWCSMTPMLSPRGRFDVTMVKNVLYAFGGSNGSTELNTAECYEVECGVENWRAISEMPTAVCSACSATIDNMIYVIGGLQDGQCIRQLQIYNIKTQEWTVGPDMLKARSQACVVAYKKRLIVIGGCDAWNPLNSVEEYDTETRAWRFLEPLKVARRGAAACVLNDQLYVVGGSNGTCSLSSVDIFDFESKSWSAGPILGVPRANVGAQIVDGRLFVIGGYNGKEFLESIEYLSDSLTEWCNFVPQTIDNMAKSVIVLKNGRIDENEEDKQGVY